MAIPVVSPNTPSAGYIQWESFSIQYLGQTYTIPQGNTNLRWVWWKYNSGGETTLLDAGQDLPSDLNDNDLVILGNKNGIPLRIQSTSLVDGDLLIDGSVFTKALDSEAVTAEVVKAESLTGDLFAGQVVLGSTISTGELDDNGSIVGARAEMGPAGIFTIDSDGNAVVKFPLSSIDSAFVRAHMEMLSAEVKDNFKLHGKKNSLATESELYLANSIQPPSAPATVTALYDTVQLQSVSVGPHSPSGGFNLGVFAPNFSQTASISWDSVWNCWCVAEQRSGGVRLWRYNANGTIHNNFSSGLPWVDDFNAWTEASICFDGSETSLFGKYGGAYFIMGRTPGGSRVINTIPTSWITDYSGRPPLLAYDHINNQYMLCQSDGGGAGTFRVRRFTCVTGSNYPNAVSQSLFSGEAASGISARVNGCVYGTQVTNGGAVRYAMSSDTYYGITVLDGAGVVKDDDGSYENWSKPAPCRAFAHNGTQFVSMDSTGKLVHYENWNWPQLSDDSWIAVSAFDSDTAGDQANPHTGQSAGQHETPVGEPLKFDQARRAKLRITVPETDDGGGADDPDKWRIYYARKSTAPTSSDLKLVSSIGSPTAPSSVTITSDPSGAAPPGGIAGTPGAVNNFPGGTPARIESSALDLLGQALIKLSGNGSWRLGHLAGNADGTDANDTGWQTLTPGSGYAIQTGTPRVRRIGNKVRFEAFIKRTSGSFTATTGFSNLINIPVGYRPAAPIYAMVSGQLAEAAARCVVATDGWVDIATSATVASYIAIFLEWYID